MQLTLELDRHLAARLHQAAQTAGVTPTEWIKHLIENHTTPTWPASVKALVGVWRDEPWPEDPQHLSTGQDVPREPF